MPWDRPNDTYRKGGHWVIDDVTGFKVRNWDTRKQWNGYRTADPDVRNPQDYARSPKPRLVVPNPSPEPDAVFLTDNEITRSSF